MIARTLAIAVIVAGVAQTETLDRIAVTVGRDVITESDLVRILKVTAFLDRKPVDLSAPAKRQAADRLVDQLLILREAVDSHVTLPSTEAKVGLVNQYASENGYQAALERYGISETDLGEYLLAGLRTLHFTDRRFRFDQQVSAEEALIYYEKLLRQPGSAAGPVPSFEDSRVQIEKLILDQRVLEALDQWLTTARSAARIQYRDKVFQ